MENNPNTHELLPYLEALELEWPPFTAQLRDNRYFLDADLEQQLNQLKHLVQSSPMLLVITGTTGSGKTTLKEMFLQSAADNLQCCEISATSEMDADELLNRLAVCLDLPENLGKKVTFTLLEDKTSSLLRHDRYPVLLVDDAHLLPRETIDLLIHLQQGNEKQASPWHIVLFTHPTLTTELLQLHIRQHYIGLNPLSHNQLRAYLEHRLRIAGLTGDFPFSESVLDKIEEQSGGIPGEINQAAHEYLMGKFSRPARPGKKRTSKKETGKAKGPHILRWASVVVLAGLIVTALLFQDEINQLFQAGPGNKDTKKEVLKLPQEPGYLLKKLPKTVVIERAKPFVPPEKETKPVINLPKVAAKSTQPPVIEAKKPEITSVKPDVKPEKPVASQTTGQEGKKPVATDLKAGPITPAKQNNILGKEWVLAQNPARYTIQLAAAASTKTLQDLVASSKLGDPKAIFTIKRNASDWSVLLYGSYQSAQEALKTVERLPGTLRRNQPWVRKLAKVQEEIQQGHK